MAKEEEGGGSKEGEDRFRVHSYRTLETSIPGLILEMPNDRIELLLRRNACIPGSKLARMSDIS